MKHQDARLDLKTEGTVKSSRKVNADKLVATIKRLQNRIHERFSDAGLFQLAVDFEDVTEKAIERAEAIRKPNWWLRISLALLAAVVIIAIVVNAPSRDQQVSFWRSLFEFLDATKFGTVVLMATPIFLITRETQIKRRRALSAIHELRAMAHLIDMYQLTKAPDQIGQRSGPRVGDKLMKPKDMDHYLNFCIELLAVISKIGHLYVQGFPDKVAVEAVDRFEELAASLSNKIWQKLMIIDRIRADIKRAKVSARRRRSEDPSRPSLFE